MLLLNWCAHVCACMQGCNTFTFSPAVMEQLCFVGETETAAADFEEAAKRSLKHKLS